MLDAPRLLEAAGRLVRGLGLERMARAVHMQLDRKRRERQRRDREEMERYSTVLAKIGAQLMEPAQARSDCCLVVGMSGTRYILQQIPVLAGVVARGLKPIIVLSSRSQQTEQELYRLCGITQFVFWQEQPRATEISGVIEEFRRCKTQEEVIRITWHEIAVGKYAISTLMRALRSGKLDPRNRAIRAHLDVMLRRALNHAAAAEKIVLSLRPQLAVFVDRGYTPEGPLYDACLRHGVEAVTFNAAHRDNTLMLKRYRATNSNVHPSSLSDQTWVRLRAMRWSERHWGELRAQLEYCYGSGQWYGEVGTQFNTRRREAKELRAELRLRAGKKCVLLFPHIFWDATFFWGEDLFEGYEEWFRECVRVAWQNDKVDWIIKVHPANVIKNQRDEVTAEFSENKVLAEFGPAPGHIRVIPANTQISTLSLYSIADICLTVRGTVGIEAAAYGLSVITAGTGRYDKLGFTLDIQERGRYLDILRSIENVPAPLPTQTELARRYAYGVFLARPIELTSVCFHYAQERGAPLRIKIQEAALRDILACPDVTAIQKWLTSGEEDFLAENMLGDVSSEPIAKTGHG
jgi:hypothetical protein